ncbi:type IV secretion system protein [Sphingomonas sp. CFBP 13603]|uniref:type IV secretion system protein n=1 Tax=Sphingomonas sp. CFBP 13603 TaxID=2774040 RepID=UPI00186923EF|nr:type IV secretion system protein [Sphingomonas sp. CFBP 13603]MBE2993023.1 type IV secretion system protein [Sphingomonas sp. CFBP 13603]
MSLSRPFTAMWNYISSAIDTSVSGLGSGLVTFVVAPLGIAATIYFLLLGFAVLRGAIQAPLRELVFQAGKVGFVIAAASSIGYTTFAVNVVTNLPDEIISAGTGTPVTNPGTTFDLYVVDVVKITRPLWLANEKVQRQQAGGIFNVSLSIQKLEYFILMMLAVFILYIFAAVSAVAGFCIVIFAKLSVAICVALAPLALACLLFGSSRWLFDGWLKQTANYILLMVVMAIMTRFVTSLQTTAMNDVMTSIDPTGNYFLTVTGVGIGINAAKVLVAVVAALLIYAVGTLFFFHSPSIAAGIAGGASSAGHGFLQTGANMMANRLMLKRATQNNKDKVGGDQKGGSATRS